MIVKQSVVCDCE